MSLDDQVLYFYFAYQSYKNHATQVTPQGAQALPVEMWLCGSAQNG
ncbi:uncharacterized protein Dvar_63490 [Desulfosarcina variabilis str. Montpellier]